MPLNLGAVVMARPFHLKFGSGGIVESRGLQHEINFHGFKGKNDSTSLRTLKNTSVQQRCYVTVHRLYVTANAPRGLPNRHRTRSTERLEKFPALD